jgi:hypothetical protein
MIWTKLPIHIGKKVDQGFYGTDRARYNLYPCISNDVSIVIGDMTAHSLPSYSAQGISGGSTPRDQIPEHMMDKGPWNRMWHQPGGKILHRRIADICREYADKPFAVMTTAGSREFQRLDFTKLKDAAVYVVPQASLSNDDNVRNSVSKYDHAVHIYPLRLMSHLWVMPILQLQSFGVMDWRLFYHWAATSAYLEVNTSVTAAKGDGISLCSDYYYDASPWAIWRRKNPDVDKRIRQQFVVHNGQIIKPDNSLCDSCPNLLKRGTYHCHPFSYNCILGEDRFKSMKQAKEPDYVSALGVDAYQDPKDCIARVPFRSFVAVNMLGLKLAKDIERKKLSDNAVKAAVTRNGRKLMCEGCLLRTDPKVYHRGDAKVCGLKPHSCGGPFFSDDVGTYMPWQSIEPWKLDTLLTLSGMWIDGKYVKLHPRWKSVRSRQAAVMLPTVKRTSVWNKEHDTLKVISSFKKYDLTKLVKCWINNTLTSLRSYYPYELVCEALGKTPANTIADVVTAHPWLPDATSQVHAFLWIVLGAGKVSCDYTPLSMEIGPDYAYARRLDYKHLDTRPYNMASGNYLQEAPSILQSTFDAGRKEEAAVFLDILNKPKQSRYRNRDQLLQVHRDAINARNAGHDVGKVLRKKWIK